MPHFNWVDPAEGENLYKELIREALRAKRATPGPFQPPTQDPKTPKATHTAPSTPGTSISAQVTPLRWDNLPQPNIPDVQMGEDTIADSYIDPLATPGLTRSAPQPTPSGMDTAQEPQVLPRVVPPQVPHQDRRAPLRGR